MYTNLLYELLVKYNQVNKYILAKKTSTFIIQPLCRPSSDKMVATSPNKLRTRLLDSFSSEKFPRFRENSQLPRNFPRRSALAIILVSYHTWREAARPSARAVGERTAQCQTAAADRAPRTAASGNIPAMCFDARLAAAALHGERQARISQLPCTKCGKRGREGNVRNRRRMGLRRLE